mmetsp:Transcript_86907/g.168339  ORF Transcript_86907/g.168339 Transcript_86907/m.168339 type:complete len:104 (+) Transcript_86907:198-509(+)
MGFGDGKRTKEKEYDGVWRWVFRHHTTTQPGVQRGRVMAPCVELSATSKLRRVGDFFILRTLPTCLSEEDSGDDTVFIEVRSKLSKSTAALFGPKRASRGPEP